MNRTWKQKSRAWFAIASCLAAFALQSCSSVDPERVKQEDGYLYGYGKGGSLEEAELEAKRDLIANALESSMRKRSGEARRVNVTLEAARGISLETKRVAELKGSDSTSVTLRVREEDWQKFEATREASLRKELAPALGRLSDSRPYAERVASAAETLSRLELAGVEGLLTVEEGGDSLLSDAIVETLAGQSATLSLALSPANGILSADASVAASLVDSAGAAIAGVPLAAVWSRDGEEIGGTAASARTDSRGNALFRVPALDVAASPSVTLRVTAGLSTLAQADARRTAARLSSIDERIAADATFVVGDSLASRFGPFVRVEAGPYAMGAVAGDKRASKREAPREAETGAYEIAADPVTNAQYRTFLDATGYAVVPDFLDNPEYTLPDQPVVGVTRADAEAFVSWLSIVTGSTVRLPTEAEWEKAAKAGRNVAFPWGDENAADGERGNFRGNGKYKRPSPVGSFPNGANPWGMRDMAGNVWELVASPAGEAQVSKGGSWMEGPNDLRISNRRETDPAKTYADVGFRVVMEVKK